METTQSMCMTNGPLAILNESLRNRAAIYTIVEVVRKKKNQTVKF